MRVELASEAYMDRLRREWAERDGGPPEQQPEAAVSSSAPPAAGEGEGEQQQPGKRREKRYLRLRRKAGEKALVVDTLPLLLRAEDKSSGSGKKRPRFVGRVTLVFVTCRSSFFLCAQSRIKSFVHLTWAGFGRSR